MTNIRIAKENEFDQIFAIMESSFPPDERRTYDAQRALLDNPKYTIYVLPDSPNRNIKAFITVWHFEDFAYIEHFAVNPAFRNEGLGSNILHEINDLLMCQLCLEVELPETDYAKRRIAFYKRNGFFVNDYPYIQPPYSKDKKPLPLIIMTSNEGISKDRFTMMKETVYREVYKIKL